jgi:hypothetical protein
MIRKLVLDVMKPHEPSILDLSKSISKLNGIDGVNITVYEIDRKVENVKITIVGSNIDFEEVKKVIEENGAVIHSVDEVATGKKMVSESKTPQDFNVRMR